MAQFKALDPAACETMTDVRAGVDEIDRVLAELLARRQRYMDAAARIKAAKGGRAAVRDEGRIAEVLANAQANANAAGLSPKIADAVWRAILEANIAYEFDVFDRLPG
jgi:isochorismate pyruvate lyase